MNIRQIQEARELYGIDEWGAGYALWGRVGGTGPETHP